MRKRDMSKKNIYTLDEEKGFWIVPKSLLSLTRICTTKTPLYVRMGTYTIYSISFLSNAFFRKRGKRDYLSKHKMCTLDKNQQQLVKPTDYVDPYGALNHLHKIPYHLSLLGSSETLQFCERQNRACFKFCNITYLRDLTFLDQNCLLITNFDVLNLPNGLSQSYYHQ